MRGRCRQPGGGIHQRMQLFGSFVVLVGLAGGIGGVVRAGAIGDKIRLRRQLVRVQQEAVDAIRLRYRLAPLRIRRRGRRQVEQGRQRGRVLEQRLREKAGAVARAVHAGIDGDELARRRRRVLAHLCKQGRQARQHAHGQLPVFPDARLRQIAVAGFLDAGHAITKQRVGLHQGQDVGTQFVPQRRERILRGGLLPHRIQGRVALHAGQSARPVARHQLRVDGLEAGRRRGIGGRVLLRRIWRLGLVMAFDGQDGTGVQGKGQRNAGQGKRLGHGFFVVIHSRTPA
ncbi:hypothetical protein D3C81_1225710 [compost metagenome]